MVEGKNTLPWYVSPHDVAAVVAGAALALVISRVKTVRRMGPLWIVAALIVFRLAYLGIRFAAGKPVFDSDIALYYQYGSRIAAGQPVNAEYPELALGTFALGAYLSPSLTAFRAVYPLLTLPFGCLATYMIIKLASRLGAPTETATACALLYALSPFTMIFWAFKFDEVAVALMLTGLYCIERSKSAVLALSTALGTLLKWFPIVILPVAIIHYAKTKPKVALQTVLLCIATIVAILIAFHSVTKTSWTFAYAYQASRPIDGESIYYLIEFALTGVLISPSSWATPVYMTNEFVLGVELLSGIAWLGYLIRKTDAANLTYLSGLTVVFLVLVNKVYSTQYIVWVVPILLLCLAQLGAKVTLPQIAGITTAIQILNYLKAPALAGTAAWIVASALFWAGLAGTFFYLLRNSNTRRSNA